MILKTFWCDLVMQILCELSNLKKKQLLKYFNKGAYQSFGIMLWHETYSQTIVATCYVFAMVMYALYSQHCLMGAL